MGRTVAPYSWQIERVRERFRKFRRALRRDDQKLFDELMLFAKLHVHAGVMASSPNPADTVFLSILIEQQRQLLRHTVELERLRGELQNSLLPGGQPLPIQEGQKNLTETEGVGEGAGLSRIERHGTHPETRVASEMDAYEKEDGSDP